MRKGIIGLSLLLTISLIPAYSATPPKAGAACSKQGVTKTYQGKKYTCVKSGKKLVWNKGLEVKKTNHTLSPAPTPTSTPIPKISPTPTPYPTFSPGSNGTEIQEHPSKPSLVRDASEELNYNTC